MRIRIQGPKPCGFGSRCGSWPDFKVTKSLMFFCMKNNHKVDNRSKNIHWKVRIRSNFLAPDLDSGQPDQCGSGSRKLVLLKKILLQKLFIPKICCAEREDGREAEDPAAHPGHDEGCQRAVQPAGRLRRHCRYLYVQQGVDPDQLGLDSDRVADPHSFHPDPARLNTNPDPGL
jgi:hypothetical protein